MLDMGFEPAIRDIMTSRGIPDKHQTQMYSATFPKSIQALAKAFMPVFVTIAVGRVGSANNSITQKIIQVEHLYNIYYLLSLDILSLGVFMHKVRS